MKRLDKEPIEFLGFTLEPTPGIDPSSNTNFYSHRKVLSPGVVLKLVCLSGSKLTDDTVVCVRNNYEVMNCKFGYLEDLSIFESMDGYEAQDYIHWIRRDLQQDGLAEYLGYTFSVNITVFYELKLSINGFRSLKISTPTSKQDAEAQVVNYLKSCRDSICGFLAFDNLLSASKVQG